jgi:hypothetical protein
MSKLPISKKSVNAAVAKVKAAEKKTPAKTPEVKEVTVIVSAPQSFASLSKAEKKAAAFTQQKAELTPGRVTGQNKVTTNALPESYEGASGYLSKKDCKTYIDLVNYPVNLAGNVSQRMNAFVHDLRRYFGANFFSRGGTHKQTGFAYMLDAGNIRQLLNAGLLEVREGYAADNLGTNARAQFYLTARALKLATGYGKWEDVESIIMDDGQVYPGHGKAAWDGKTAAEREDNAYLGEGTTPSP